MSGRPKPRSSGQIIEDAKTILELPQIKRLPKVTDLLAESRASSETSFDEILQAAGYKDLTEYWNLALSREMPVSRYARILAIHNSDRSLTSYSAAYHQIHEALKTAGKEGRRWLLGPYLHDVYEDGDFRSADVNEDGWRGMFVLPPEATEWLLDNKIYGGLIPASLRELCVSANYSLASDPRLVSPSSEACATRVAEGTDSGSDPASQGAIGVKPETNIPHKHKGGRNKLDRTRQFEQWYKDLPESDRQLPDARLAAIFISTYPQHKRHEEYLRRLVPGLKKETVG